MSSRFNVLTLSGSLRTTSSNRAMLDAFAAVAPPELQFTPYSELNALPHFNPDLDTDPLPSPVTALRDAVRSADALLIATPEYMHALPGAFKNLLDWLVSDPTFPGKFVAILHADRGSDWAWDSLREVLRTMSATLIEPACIRLKFESNRIDATLILATPELQTALHRAAAEFYASLVRHP